MAIIFFLKLYHLTQRIIEMFKIPVTLAIRVKANIAFKVRITMPSLRSTSTVIFVVRDDEKTLLKNNVHLSFRGKWSKNQSENSLLHSSLSISNLIFICSH